MSKTGIKSKIEGNEVDLSLNDLSVVPVQELASVPKATHLDLSCNKIKTLPKNFPTLTHLVKIDLSKNILTELPQNFGNLVNLQHLDLYENQIVDLPVSFCRLKHLKWLDLKNNPLDSKLKFIAGDCLDAKQCQTCAKDVVSFMQSIESELERQKQNMLKKERAKAAAKLAAEEKELAEQRKLKKAEREKRKAEAKARNLEKQNSNNNAEKPQQLTDNDDPPTRETSKERTQGSCAKVVMSFIIVVLLSILTLIGFAVLGSEHEIKSTNDIITIVDKFLLEAQSSIQIWWYAFAQPYFLSLKMNITDWVKSLTQ